MTNMAKSIALIAFLSGLLLIERGMTTPDSHGDVLALTGGLLVGSIVFLFAARDK